jgi:hypothetical protein
MTDTQAAKEILRALYDQMLDAHYALLFVNLRGCGIISPELEEFDPTIGDNLQRMLVEKGVEASGGMFETISRLEELYGLHGPLFNDDSELEGSRDE